MKYLLPYIVLMVLSTLVACGSSDVDMALDRTEALMEECPDSALAIVSAIDSREISGRQRRARYAVLLTQARYKNFDDETDDSLIATAIRYYRHHDNPSMLVRAAFLRARILENAGNYTRSIIYALDAERAALEINSPLWLARIYELIADLQEESYNVPEAIKYRKKSIDYYKKSDYEFLSCWMSVDLANAYYEMHDSINYVKSIHLLDSVMDVCKDSIYSDYFFGHLYTSYLGPLYALSKYDMAIMKFRELQKSYPDYEISSQSYSYIGRCFIEVNMDSAEFYYRKSLTAHSRSKLSEYITLYNILIKQRDFEKALDIKNKISFIDDSIATYQVRQSLALAQSDYFAIMAKKEHRIARRHKAFLIFGSLFSGIIIFVVCLFYRERVLRKNAELSEWVGKFEDVSADFDKANSINKKLRITLEDIRKEAVVVSSELDEHKTKTDELTSVVERLYGSHFKTLNLICSEYLDKNDASDKVKLTIFKSLKKEIDRMSNPQSLKNLEEMVNICNNDVLNKFKDQFPEMSSDNISFAALFFAGLSPRAISLILKISQSNCYTKRFRLRERIKESTVPDKELFLKYI